MAKLGSRYRYRNVAQVQKPLAAFSEKRDQAAGAFEIALVATEPRTAELSIESGNTFLFSDLAVALEIAARGRELPAAPAAPPPACDRSCHMPRARSSPFIIPAKAHRAAIGQSDTGRTRMVTSRLGPCSHVFWWRRGLRGSCRAGSWARIRLRGRLRCQLGGRRQLRGRLRC